MKKQWKCIVWFVIWVIFLTPYFINYLEMLSFPQQYFLTSLIMLVGSITLSICLVRFKVGKTERLLILSFFLYFIHLGLAIRFPLRLDQLLVTERYFLVILLLSISCIIIYSIIRRRFPHAKSPERIKRRGKIIILAIDILTVLLWITAPLLAKKGTPLIRGVLPFGLVWSSGDSRIIFFDEISQKLGRVNPINRDVAWTKMSGFLKGLALSPDGRKICFALII